MSLLVCRYAPFTSVSTYLVFRFDIPIRFSVILVLNIPFSHLFSFSLIQTDFFFPTTLFVYTSTLPFWYLKHQCTQIAFHVSMHAFGLVWAYKSDKSEVHSVRYIFFFLSPFISWEFKKSSINAFLPQNKRCDETVLWRTNIDLWLRLFFCVTPVRPMPLFHLDYRLSSIFSQRYLLSESFSTRLISTSCHQEFLLLLRPKQFTTFPREQARMTAWVCF